MAELTAEQSFSKSLVLGEIAEDLIFPFPVRREPAEEDRIRSLVGGFRAYAPEHVDSRRPRLGVRCLRAHRDRQRGLPHRRLIPGSSVV